MKITDFGFVFVFFLSLSLLTWTTVKSIQNPVEHENLFSTNYKDLDANFNNIKEQEREFNKLSSLNYEVLSDKISMSVSNKAEIISTEALLTRPHTNKDNQKLEIVNKKLQSLEVKIPKLTIGKWKVNIKMEVKLDNNKLTIYKHIPITKDN